MLWAMDSPEQAAAPITAPKGALLTIFLIVFVDLLGFGLIIPLLPFYARQFSASNVQITLLFSVYSICQFIASPILGMLSDRFGRKPVLVFSQFGSAVGFALLGWASGHAWASAGLGLAMIYLSRIIDGLSGGNISTAQAYISDITTTENRAKGMGLLGAAFGLGFVAGPALGGMLHYYVGPAAAAYAAGSLALIAAILSATVLKESRAHQPVESEAWLHPRKFLPILKLSRPVQLMGIWFVTMSAFVMVDSTIALYLADVFHYNAAQVAWYFVMIGLIVAGVQGGLIGRLSRHGREWILCTLGPILVACGYVITLSSAWRPAGWILIVGGSVYATGRSLQQPVISSLMSKLTPPTQQGTAFGLFQGIGTLARATGPVAAGFIYDAHVTGPFWLAAALVLAAAAWTWRLGRNVGPVEQIESAADSRDAVGSGERAIAD